MQETAIASQPDAGAVPPDHLSDSAIGWMPPSIEDVIVNDPDMQTRNTGYEDSVTPPAYEDVEMSRWVSQALKDLDQIETFYEGDPDPAAAVDAEMEELVDAATAHGVPEDIEPIIYTMADEEIIRTGGHAELTVEAEARAPEERTEAALKAIATVEGERPAGFIRRLIKGAREGLSRTPDAGKLHTKMYDVCNNDDQKFIDLYKAGDGRVRRMVRAASKVPIDTESKTSLLVHNRALAALESVHGDALSWRDSGQATGDRAVAEYAQSKLLPLAYFNKRYVDYEKKIKPVTDAEARSEKAGQSPTVNTSAELLGQDTELSRYAAEQLGVLEDSLKRSVRYALEMAGPDDPITQIVSEYGFGSRQTFGFRAVGKDGRIAIPRYGESGKHYLENVCKLGRENVMTINRETGIVNFDRYNYEQLDLARRFANRDPQTIEDLNRDGMDWIASTSEGDWDDFSGSIRMMRTEHAVPFEIRAEKGKAFDRVQDAIEGRGISNVRSGHIQLHGGPYEFYVSRNTGVRTVPLSFPRPMEFQRLADSVSLRRLLGAIVPDASGYRNLTLAMCESAGFDRKNGSVADAMASMVPNMRIMAADGYASIRSAANGRAYMHVSATYFSGHQQPSVAQLVREKGTSILNPDGSVKKDVPITPTFVMSGSQPEYQPTELWKSQDHPSYPTSRRQADSHESVLSITSEAARRKARYN